MGRLGNSAGGGGAVPSTLASGTTLPNPVITGTAVVAEVEGLERVVDAWGVPIGLAPSGTMADNGAVTFGTALGATYTGGIWLYYPAGAVAAGVPGSAGFLWTVMASTTVGTVYNSTFDGTSVPGVGTATAFATTGPGAFTGVAAGEITVATVPIGAADIGTNGHLNVEAGISFNTAAGNKIVRAKLGGTTLSGTTLSTSAFNRSITNTVNLGSAAIQRNEAVYQGSSFSSTTSYTAVNTANAQNLTITLEKATATNYVIVEGTRIRIAYAA